MLRIFGVTNHVGNQYEMLKLAKKYQVKFSYLKNNVRRWTEYSARPEPTTFLNKNQFEWVTCYEPGKYDLAILHVDQQHVNPNIGKGFLYKQMNEVIKDIPKIVINHGTPMYPEIGYTDDQVINGGPVLDSKGKKDTIIGMKGLIGDNFMVVNSYKAVERWGWGYPLIHGMDENEWFDRPKEPRVVISLSPGGLDKYYNRQLLSAIKGEVYEKIGQQLTHITVNWDARDWKDYREFLGSSLLYINPTLDSPMPRSRTEAMFSGCCVLTSKHHDADEFITPGVNGFIVPDNPISYADTINELMNYHYEECVEIGQRARETAIKYFNLERYLKDLWKIVEGVASGKPPVWNGEKIWKSQD